MSRTFSKCSIKTVFLCVLSYFPIKNIGFPLYPPPMSRLTSLCSLVSQFLIMSKSLSVSSTSPSPSSISFSPLLTLFLGSPEWYPNIDKWKHILAPNVWANPQDRQLENNQNTFPHLSSLVLRVWLHHRSVHLLYCCMPHKLTHLWGNSVLVLL